MSTSSTDESPLWGAIAENICSGAFPLLTHVRHRPAFHVAVAKPLPPPNWPTLIVTYDVERVPAYIDTNHSNCCVECLACSLSLAPPASFANGGVRQSPGGVIPLIHCRSRVSYFIQIRESAQLKVSWVLFAPLSARICTQLDPPAVSKMAGGPIRSAVIPPARGLYQTVSLSLG